MFFYSQMYVQIFFIVTVGVFCTDWTWDAVGFMISSAFDRVELMAGEIYTPTWKK